MYFGRETIPQVLAAESVYVYVLENNLFVVRLPTTGRRSRAIREPLGEEATIFLFGSKWTSPLD